jgi:TetR/AcrR family fatty acid metabolism transcriptional regulator
MKRDLDTYRKNKEDAIFQAALRVIKRKGYHKARMSDIAKEAAISYGLVYHYFGNKQDLFETILHRWWNGLFDLMAEINRAAPDVPEKLKRIILYFLDTYQTEPELVNIFITEISRSTSGLTRLRLENFKKFIFLTEDFITRGQKEGVLRSDFKARYLTYIFLGALETFVSAMVLGEQPIKGDVQKERIAESILEVFLNGARSRRRKGKS